MDVISLKYPVLCLTKYGLSCLLNPDWLTIAFVANLRSDYYEKLTVIDARGTAYSVAEVKKVGWVGPFFGFSFRYSRRVRIEMRLVAAANQLSLNELKEIVLRDFRKSSEWSSRGDFDELSSRVQGARSVAEIVQVICST